MHGKKTKGTKQCATPGEYVRQQCGALYIEATLCLSFFMFAIFTLLSVIQISYTQARMAAALDCAAKELAEYTHVYYATGLAQILGEGGGASSRLFDKLGEYLSGLGGDISAINSDLGDFLIGAGNALEGDNISQWLQSSAGKDITKKLMEKNMVSGANDSAEDFKRRNHIISMNMNGSRFLESGGSDVFMQVNYDVRVVQLLGIDITFHMRHCAYTKAWK